MGELDGVIKFALAHSKEAIPENSRLDALQQWFRICRKHQLIGQDPGRYGGAAYGNISQRAEQGFLITGTQTGGQDSLGDLDIAWVKTFDVNANQVESAGPIQPSSESLSHGQIYEALPEIHFVIHIHHKPLWESAARLGLEITDPKAAYGTPTMAMEVDRLLHHPATLQTGAFSMGGHEDGLIVFGCDANQAGNRLLKLLDGLG